MRAFLTSLLLSLSLLLPTYAFAFEQFPTEEAAQKHCPTDSVVWLNIPTYVWHYKGQRWYGNTKHGAYVCMKEAADEGAHGTKNGQ